MADVLGVDKELGFSLSTDKYFSEMKKVHFISADHGGNYDFGEGMNNIYALSEKTEIVEYSDGEVHLAANPYGEGRGVYIAGLPYNHDNTRLLLRSLYYAAHKEGELHKWFAENAALEVHAYPQMGKYAVLNNSNQAQSSLIYDGTGASFEVDLPPGGMRWFEM